MLYCFARSLPESRARRGDHRKSQLFDTMSVSFPNFQDWQAQSNSYSQIAAVHPQDFNLKDASGAKRVAGRNVSADFFKALGIKPALGEILKRQMTVRARLRWPSSATNFGSGNLLPRAVSLAGTSSSQTATTPL